jgi:hypothetical protein
MPHMTIREAAAELRKSERWLRDWLQGHPYDAHGRAFFALAGRTKLFTADDINRIDEAMRPVPRPNLLRPVRGRRTGQSAASPSLWAEAARLTGDPSLARGRTSAALTELQLLLGKPSRRK